MAFYLLIGIIIEQRQRRGIVSVGIIIGAIVVRWIRRMRLQQLDDGRNIRAEDREKHQSGENQRHGPDLNPVSATEPAEARN